MEKNKIASHNHVLTQVWENEPELFELSGQHTKNEPPLERVFADYFALGPYYYYVVSLPGSTLSHHHENILKMHGLKKLPETLSEIIDLIHPDDLQFVVEAEKMSYQKVREIGLPHVLDLKTSYCFRMRTGKDTYELFHHQAIHTLQSDDGTLVQAVNIHTNIQHITSKNPYTVLITGVGGRTDFHQLQYKATQNESSTDYSKLTARETEILIHIAHGNSAVEIANLLHISEHTVKSHRKNIIDKMQVRNSRDLIRKAVELAII